MTDKSLFRRAADSITKWVDESDERQRKEALEQEERQKIFNGTLIESVRDTSRDLKEGIAALWDTIGSERKFLHEYNLRSGRFEESWRENVSKKIGYEKFGFSMASGWELPKGTLFNGKLAPEKEGKKIEGLTAVFLRGKEGKIEVLDHHDPRYADLVVPYLITQLIVPSMAGKAFGALSLISKGTKAAEIVKTAADTAGKTWAVADNVSGLYLASTQVSSNFMLKPDAIRRLGRLMESPQNMDTNKLRDELNIAFQEHSYGELGQRAGPLSGQYKVPPIPLTSSPFTRLDDLARGSIHGIYKRSTPFENFGKEHFKEDENLTEVRNAVREDRYFQRGYFRLATKALSGAKLTEQENTLLSFGTRVFTGIADEAVTPETLPKMLAVRMMIEKDPQETNAQYLGKIKQEFGNYLTFAEKRVKTEEGFEKQQAMANSMAFTVH